MSRGLNGDCFLVEGTAAWQWISWPTWWQLAVLNRNRKQVKDYALLLTADDDPPLAHAANSTRAAQYPTPQQIRTHIYTQVYFYTFLWHAAIHMSHRYYIIPFTHQFHDRNNVKQCCYGLVTHLSFPLWVLGLAPASSKTWLRISGSEWMDRCNIIGTDIM